MTAPPAIFSTPLRRRSDVLCRELDGEAVLLDLDSGWYYGLNEVGARAWSLLGEGLEAAAIVDRLLAEYDVSEATLERDLADLLRELAANGLLEPPPAPGPEGDLSPSQ